MGHIALLNLLVRAESAGFDAKIEGNELRIPTGGRRAIDATSTERMLGLGDTVWEMYANQIWLVIHSNPKA